MRKYFEVSKLYMKQQMIWRGEVGFQLLSSVLRVLFAWILWGAVFQSRNEVASFGFQGMLTYYLLVTLFISSDVSGEISTKVSEEIRNGRFSKYLVRPIGKEGYFTAMGLGKSLFSFGVNSIVMLAMAQLFRVRMEITGEWIVLAGAFTMYLLGLVFMLQFNYFLGILTLKFEEISFFLMIKDNLIQLLGGGMIPLVLLPDGLLRILQYTPFYYTTYLPAMLVTGRNKEQLFSGTGILLLWTAGTILCSRIIYKSLKEKYDGAGL